MKAKGLENKTMKPAPEKKGAPAPKQPAKQAKGKGKC